MKRLPLLLLLLVFITPASAEIYKDVDTEGNVTYSDEETPTSEKVPTPSPNTITMPKLPPREKSEDVEQVQAGYKMFRIASPHNDATIRSNEGNVTVNLAIEPALHLKEGHTITVMLDGRVMVRDATQTSITLNNIDRGSHTIRARVLNRQGRTLISSNSIRVHMKRLSTQHGKPEGRPPGPTTPEGTTISPGPQGSRFVPGPVTPATNP